MKASILILLAIVVWRGLYGGLSFVSEQGSFGSALTSSGLRNDAWWYLRIAEEGYPRITDRRELGYVDRELVVQSAWAFFPAYPVLVGGLARAFGISTPMTMFWLSWPLAFAAALFFFRFSERWQGARAAWWSLGVLLLCPMGIYMHVYYTEGLFLAALMGAFWAFYAERRGPAALCCVVLVLVRPNGLLILLPIALFILERADISLRTVLSRRREVWRHMYPLIPAVLAFMTYCVYQWVRTGTPFAFSVAQGGWDRHLTWPFLAFFRSGDVATQVESWYSIVLVLLTMPLWKRLPLSFNVLLWVNILLPLCSGSPDSMIRFTLGMFPYFLLFGGWLEHARLRWIILGAFVVLQMGWWVLWLDAHPITA